MTRSHAENHFYNNCRYILISNAIVKVRNKLAKSYNINSGPYYKYSGLCDTACAMVAEHITKANENHNFNYRIKYKYFHGEQKHTPRIKSDFWPMEHTWMKITITSAFETCSWYVDPTSGQFQTIYNDIPDFYISEKKPKWYYPDECNPRFGSRILNWINEHVYWKRYHIWPDGDKSKVKVNIVEFLQYDVWGFISDIIHNHKTETIEAGR